MQYRKLSEAGATPDVPDVRGWVVRDADDRRVGTVADVLLGEDGAPRYLDVRAGGLLDPKRLLLPIGVVTLDPDRRALAVRGMRNDDIRALPEYAGDPERIGDELEGRLRLGIPPTAGGDIFSTRYLYTPPPRAEPATDATSDAPRGAYEAPDGGAVRETDEEIVVPIVEEELVVETRPVVKEELVIRKRLVQETHVVEADLRKEVVDVQEHGRTR